MKIHEHRLNLKTTYDSVSDFFSDPFNTLSWKLFQLFEMKNLVGMLYPTKQEVLVVVSYEENMKKLCLKKVTLKKGAL